MSGASIAADIAAALSEVARDVGSGSFNVTLIEPAPAATPWAEAGTATETGMAALVQDYPRKLIDGTLIQQGDQRVMLPATGPRPSTGDKLRISSIEYRVIMVRDIAPAGIALYYEVQARV